VQIPLDYYRIIGVPIQADSDLINLAYQDRMVQMPRHEYSESAIASRQKLIEQAYNILSDEKLRQKYEEEVFPQQTESVINGDDNIETKISVKEAISLAEKEKETLAPTIDIEDKLLIGALMMLQELGEYELVLTIAQPYLEGKEKLANITDNTDELRILWQDLVLTVVSAHLDLARENWQQQQYESASHYLVNAYHILDTENLFNNIRKEIDVDIHKLYPYEVIELLSKENSELKDRQNAIALINKMLDSRGGMETLEQDKSGLNQEDFLQFIKQIRVYLTPIEQQYLFERESKRPSSSASHLNAYVLIARGFTERKPDLIIQAQNILKQLYIHQDVNLEKAITAFLLGEIGQAQNFVQHSIEKEKTQYIKEKSQGSPDLVPGLILYTEKWLETEVFPQFKNLNKESSSVQEYFNDARVQNYLEEIATSAQQLPTTETDSFSEDLPEVIHDEVSSKYRSIDRENLGAKLGSTTPPTMNLLVSNHQAEESDLIGLNSFLEENLEGEFSTNFETTDTENQEDELLTENELLEEMEETSNKNIKPPLIGLFIFLLLLSFLAFLVYRVFNPSTPNNDLEISLGEPLIELPEDIAAEQITSQQNPLTAETALSLVATWLEAKAQGTGPNYNVEALEVILTEPLLSIWRGNIVALRSQNAYRRYEHDITVEGVSINPQNNNEGNITARVREKSQFFINGNLDDSRSYEEDLLVRYDVVKINNQWFMRNTQIIN